jgi:hypothetical protein
LFRRNRRFTAAGLSFSGERFRGLGGTIEGGTKGETERRPGAFYRHWEESKRARIKAGRVTVSRNGRRRG